jgi:lysozyme
MNGIDISRYQKGINLTAVPSEFVIVKASQGSSDYVYPTFKEQITEADRLGKFLGVYHYASQGGAIPEAEKFLRTVDKYIGKAILCLDWEKDDNVNFNNPQYAIAWLKYVEQKTEIKPFIYMSKSVARQYASTWDTSFPFWCAQYANYQYTGYKVNPWTDDKGFGPWKNCAIFQYSSRGRLPGYNDNLDLDKAYISAEQWLMYARGEIKTEPVNDPFPLLKKGDRNEYIRHWQMFLNMNGYACGDADGIFGPKTEAAVKAWQKNHGLVTDGIIGKKTWASLPGMK